MADAGVAADQDELARRRAGAEFLEQPEQPLDRDVHDVVRRFLAGGEMDDVGDAADRLRHGVAVGDRSLDHLDALAFGQGAVVAERPNPGAGKARILEQACNEIPPDLAGCASCEDQHAFLPKEGYLISARFARQRVLSYLSYKIA